MENQDLHCPCRTQIPLQRNDGSEVAPEELAEILHCFNRQFGGYTPLGTGELDSHGVKGGSWFGQVEPSLRIEVAVHPSRVPELRELVYAIGKQLGQKEMYFDAPPPSVEFINISEYATSTVKKEGA